MQANSIKSQACFYIPINVLCIQASGTAGLVLQNQLPFAQQLLLTASQLLLLEICFCKREKLLPS
jgi:hypothetical protein